MIGHRHDHAFGAFILLLLMYSTIFIEFFVRGCLCADGLCADGLVRIVQLLARFVRLRERAGQTASAGICDGFHLRGESGL